MAEIGAGLPVVLLAEPEHPHRRGVQAVQSDHRRIGGAALSARHREADAMLASLDPRPVGDCRPAQWPDRATGSIKPDAGKHPRVAAGSCERPSRPIAILRRPFA